MKRVSPTSSEASALRKRAEQKLRQRQAIQEQPLSDADARALLHELQVHQIELEMQNEELHRAQAEAQQAADKYTEMFDFAPVGYFILYPLSVIREVNLAGAALLGLDRRRVTGQPFEPYIAPDSRAAFAEFWRSLRPGEGRCSCDVRLLRRGQDPCDVLVEGAALASGPGEQQGYRLAVTDITDRKRAEEMIRLSEERFRDLYTNAPNAYFSVGVDGRIRKCNRVAGELLGVAPEDLAGQAVMDLYADTPQGKKGAANVLQRFRAGESVSNEELQMRKADGTPVWINLSVNPVRDADGRTIESRSVVVDITLRKAAEETLRTSEARYRSFVDVTGQLGWTTNAGGEVVEDLVSWQAYTGQTRDDVLGWGWSRALHPDDVERTVEIWQNAVAGKKSYETEYRLRRHDGVYRHFLARGVPALDAEGSIREWVGTCMDITERLQAEQRIHASLREKEVLLKEIHHRVKNNLQIVASLVNLQAERVRDPAVGALFRDLRDRMRSIALVHEKLYQSESLAAVQFAEYARSLLTYLWGAHGDAAVGIRLTLDLQPVLLPADTIVPCGLILTELATNAIKHGFPDRRAGEVTVGLTRDARTGQVCLRVSDSGTGLPEGRDWRQSPSLGLRLVQMLTQQLHGSVEAGIGPGTEFRVTFVVPEGA